MVQNVIELGFLLLFVFEQSQTVADFLVGSVPIPSVVLVNVIELSYGVLVASTQFGCSLLDFLEFAGLHGC